MCCATCFAQSNLQQLRPRTFPTSLAGKGHDTGVVCRFLEDFLTHQVPNLLPSHQLPYGFRGSELKPWLTWLLQVSCDCEMLEMALYAVRTVNKFFTILNGSGTFLSSTDSATARRAAFEFCEPCLHYRFFLLLSPCPCDLPARC